jgi:hypothetical protein
MKSWLHQAPLAVPESALAHEQAVAQQRFELIDTSIFAVVAVIILKNVFDAVRVGHQIGSFRA